ncbi:MAG: hypothetical protein LHW48_09950, partial [Candidatus Cloacimonetes bacterium]|nr:hypothetical protein [Candidatus Cloacimonadota bacterium]
MPYIPWGGKLCLPQRAQLASEGSFAASAKQELGSPYGTAQCEGWGGKLQVVTDVATSSTYLWGGKLQVVTDVATSSTYFWG